MLIIIDDFNDYLKPSHYIDFENESIIQKANKIHKNSLDELDFIKNTFHFVRDEIKHSWDVQDKRVIAKASDVLQEKVGICWAKSNLLAALLRVKGIPTGICYQRLTLGDTPDTGYCIHALNAVYIELIDKWVRLDARGNKEGIHAEMDIYDEKLAFPIRAEFDEIDYKKVYAQPQHITMEILENSDDALYMYLHSLPESI